MSKFDEKIRVFTDARKAESALVWLEEAAKVPDESIKYVSIDSRVEYGSATSGGRAASTYVADAGMSLAWEVVERARALAEEDLKRGEEEL